ncbi:MAG: hypothetical protein A2Y48_00325 [Nitrospirae bacterium RIFCSPLOW2_12_42_9]|nr:MAG: hypothetical protein A2Y48_00325 [Nitrospirae bacterium RIFCSPLOW2_12_42_9]
MKPPDILTAIIPVVEAFEKLGTHYYIGGSVASSAYGIARATLDVDMVSDLKTQHVHSLVTMLEASYYIDEEMILEAIKNRSSFNLIHLDTMLKVDVFIVKEGLYHKESFKRRRKDTMDEDEASVEFYLASPEDIILNKLDWYRMGGCISDRQWHDVIGVLKVQQNLLDMEYLQYWASELELTNLLKQAYSDAGIKPGQEL